MRSIIFLFTLLSLFMQIDCNSKPERPKKVIIRYEVLPDSILDNYLNKISLKKLERENKEFEIRVWSAFINDSFPVYMERFFIDKNTFCGEIYIFKSNHLPIESLSDLGSKSFSYSKYKVNNIPFHFSDTLQKRLDLFSFRFIEIDSIKSVIRSGMVLSVPLLELIEEVNQGSYVSVFIPAPKYIRSLDGISEYAMWVDFLEKKVLASDPKASNWLEGNLPRKK